MQYLLICTVALLGSGLTLFSGFGLGTLLLPVFALFFPVEVAIALTAVVHLLNNLFKLALLGRHAQKGVILRFGLPAIAAAYLGAMLLNAVAGYPPLLNYTLGTRELEVLPVKLLIGALLIFFALFDILPALSGLRFPPRFLPLGGLISGFFGGLSGHQGALRSAFLLRAGLGKEAFIATGVVIACLTDLSRIAVYAQTFLRQQPSEHLPLLGAATLSAFLGAYLGNKLLRKITLQALHYTVAVLLMVFGVLMGAGVI